MERPHADLHDQKIPVSLHLDLLPLIVGHVESSEICLLLKLLQIQEQLKLDLEVLPAQRFVQQRRGGSSVGGRQTQGRTEQEARSTVISK